MRILRAIVEPATDLLAIGGSDFLQRCAEGTQSASYDRFGSAVLTHCFPEEFQCYPFVAALGNEAFENLAFVIHGSPEIVLFAINLHKGFAQMPTPTTRFHALDPSFPDHSREHRAEPKPPKSDGFIADVDASLVQQIFDVPQRRWKADVEHHSKADDLRARLEVLEWGAFCHERRLVSRLARFTPSSSDSARGVAQDVEPIEIMEYRPAKWIQTSLTFAVVCKNLTKI